MILRLGWGCFVGLFLTQEPFWHSKDMQLYTLEPSRSDYKQEEKTWSESSCMGVMGKWGR